MLTKNIGERRWRKVPKDRRLWAFLIDFVLIWLLCSFTPNILVKFLIFLIGWFILRIVVVEKNKGQSLGRWALDIRVIDLRFQRTPSILSLTKREGVIGLAAFLTMIGFYWALPNILSALILSTPLLVDGGAIIADEELNQAFHDRLVNTVVIQSRRGFSLDLRLKKLLAQIRQNMRQ